MTTARMPLPRSIYIEPTSRCNELCQQCPRTLLSREDDRDLSFEDFRYIVDQQAKRNVIENSAMRGEDQNMFIGCEVKQAGAKHGGGR